MRWRLPEADPAGVKELAREIGVRSPAAQVLWNRGYRDPSAARAFLDAPLSGLLSPWLMRDMDRAAERLVQAVRAREPILLYGDYDVDGTASVVILKKAIELLGGVATFHVPHRLIEGYGMRSGVVEEAAARGIKLIVSVDTGIRAAEVVRHAMAAGIDVIISDHHLPDGDLPPATAVLNPNRPDCTYPNKALCGAGVALKIIQALLERMGLAESRQRTLVASFLKMAAIATIADVVPLTGENRIIVKHGLAGLGQVRNAGLRALLSVAGLGQGGSGLSAGQIAFRVAPRINAAGRMATANDVIDLFTTDDEARARELAEQLHALNQERQEAEAAMIAEILKRCDEDPSLSAGHALVFSAPGWHRGVVGIVANRIMERFHRPVIVLSEENGEAQGSGRSIRAFHLLEALEAMPEMFTRFGGHRHAVGLGLPVERLAEFRERFNAFAAERLTAEDLTPLIELDGVLRLGEIHHQSAMEVLSLAPFGYGNPSPLFAVRDCMVEAAPDVFSERHLRVRMRDGASRHRFTGWGMAQRAAEFAPGATLDAAVTIVDDAYSAARGYAPWALELKDFRP